MKHFFSVVSVVVLVNSSHLPRDSLALRRFNLPGRIVGAVSQIVGLKQRNLQRNIPLKPRVEYANPHFGHPKLFEMKNKLLA